MNSYTELPLTERQKQCLRLVLRGFKEKEIAREVGIHHETVRKHIKAAMARLGTNSRFVAARRLAEDDETNLSRVPPQGGMAEDPHSPAHRTPTAEAASCETAADVGMDGRSDVLCEEHVPYRRSALPQFDPIGRSREYPGTTPGTRLVMAVVLTILIAMAVISAIPMSNAVQQMANAIDPP